MSAEAFGQLITGLLIGVPIGAAIGLVMVALVVRGLR